jgi:hypothetical protein
MSRKNYLPIALGILPLLSFLMISPSEMGRKMGRLPATDVPPVTASVAERKADLVAAAKPIDSASIKIEGEPAKSHDRVEKIMTDYRKDKPHVANNDLDKKIYLSQVDGLQDLVKGENDTLKPYLLDATGAKDAKIRLEGIAQFLSQEIDDLKDVKARNLLSEVESKLVQSKIDSSEDMLENLLKALDDEAPRLAKTPEVKPVVAVAVEPKVEAKTEEAKTSETKADGKKDKKDQTDSDKLLCELQDQNKILNKNLQTQITNQQNIMMMMVMMMQNFISNQNTQMDLSRQQSLYQYTSPYAGPQANWMYQPFQAQSSLFGQPSNTNLYSGYGLQTMQGQQAQGASGSWGLRADPGLQMMDPRYTPMTGLTPGQFGGTQQSLGNFGYDMSVQPQMSIQTAPGLSVPSTAPVLSTFGMAPGIA